MNLRATA